MRSANEKKMFDLLLDEIDDTLEDIEQRCLKLESSDQKKELEIIFRAAHNVKGASQLYGLAEFGALVHSLEDLLTAIQKADRPVVHDSVDVLLNVQSFLRKWVLELRENPKIVAESKAVKQLMAQHSEEVKRGITSQAPQSNAQTEAPKIIEHEKTTTAKETPPQGSETMASSTETASLAAVDQAPQRENSVGRKRTSGTLRISSQKIDDIIQMIGELSIHQGILWHNYQNGTFNLLNCKNAVVLNQKTLKELYELVLTLRMQSADSLFQRMERTAKDVARDQKKNISIQLNGTDTPLDKTVIELITDPMMHIVRNAIDHGIEDNETRLAAGKAVPARLVIKTQQDSGQVVISISDDGRGLDQDLIYEKAQKRGLIPAGAKMSSDDINQLIFLPGFSTREQVTAISGRGVGMDIVQKAIQQLGGRIEIQSVKGKGTSFLISLPASLEIIEGLLVKVTDQIYVIPRQEVDEIIDLASFEIERAGQGGRAIRIRKSVVPVEDLSDYIGVNASKVPHSSAAYEKSPEVHQPSDSSQDIAVLIRMPDHSRLALRVDAIIRQQQIVVRPLSDHLAKVPGFSGATILGNGEPALILSASAIAQCYLNWVDRKLKNDRNIA